MRKALVFALALSFVLIASSPGFTSEDVFDKALMHYNKGDYQEAIKLLKTYVETVPDPKAYYTIGYAYYRLGKHDEAGKYFGYAYMIDPEYYPEEGWVVPKSLATEARPSKPAAPAAKTRKIKDTAASNAAKPAVESEAAKAPAPAPPPAPPVEAVTAPEPKPEPIAEAAAPAPAAEAVPAPEAATGKPPIGETAVKETPEQAAEQPTPEETPAPRARPRPSVAVSQQPSEGLGMAVMAVVLGIILLVYILFSFSLFKIAKKLGVDKAWLAWIPILQIVPFFRSAGKPLWWIVLLLVPIVNIIIMTYCWMLIADNLGKSKILGLLTLLPVLNIAIPLYLALAKTGSSPSAAGESDIGSGGDSFSDSGSGGTDELGVRGGEGEDFNPFDDKSGSSEESSPFGAEDEGFK